VELGEDRGVPLGVDVVGQLLPTLGIGRVLAGAVEGCHGGGALPARSAKRWKGSTLAQLWVCRRPAPLGAVHDSMERGG
jgi:hypothetical protein